MSSIIVSVIIPSYNARQTIGHCLHALEPQRQHADFDVEVIVVDSSADGTADIVAQQFPWVSLHRLPSRKYPGDARNIGVALAHGSLLAFTDADCVPDPNWLRAIVDAHAGPAPVIGGVIDNADPQSYVGWGKYFCEYSQWMPQSQTQWVVEIPTACLSMKRRAFEAFGPFVEGTFIEDTAFHWRLARSGQWPLLVPSIRVGHINHRRLPEFVGRLFIHGRFYAQWRVVAYGLKRRRTGLYMAGSPLLPALLLWRKARQVFRYRVYRREFVVALPLVLMGLCAWSFGEAWGYTTQLFQRHMPVPAAEPQLTPP